MNVSSTISEREVVFFLAYHKTASKWVWANFFTDRYPTKQLNILKSSIQDLQTAVQENEGMAPFVFRLRIEDGSMGAELPNLAKVMYAAFPNAKVVVGIRSQQSLLASHYGQYVANGGRLSFGRYLEQVIGNKWRYFPMIQSMREKFGERVMVYLFEELREDCFGLLRRLREFVGSPPGEFSDDDLKSIAVLPPANPRRNDLVTDAMLLLNRLHMRPRKIAIIPTIAIPGHDHIFVDIADQIARAYMAITGKPLRYRSYADKMAALRDVYGKENAALAKLLDCPLQKHGYPV